MLPPERLDEAAAYLERKFGIDTLWLFGSQAQGADNADSDVDLAALFRRRPSGLELLDAEGELGTLAGRAVQVVDLENASPIVGMQVLRHGRLLRDRDPKRRHAFFGQTVSQYEDLKIVRREAERNLLQRMGHAGS
jgi:predicted nucleotidyltransferase